MTRQPDNQPFASPRRTLAALAVTAVLLAGCGGSSSSASNGATSSSSTSGGKPAYCTSLNNLEQSVKALQAVDVAKDGTDALKSAVAQVQTNTTAVVSDAKSAFAAQTEDLKNSVTTLSNSVKGLASSPSAAQIRALRPQVSAVATATTNLANSAAPNCG